MFRNKRGLLANLISGFVIVLIVITLVPTIAQQVDIAVNCGATTIVNTTGIPNGPTNSFGGGGGDYHFGGYSGKVEHKSFLSQYSIVQTNVSILNPSCVEFPEGAAKTLLESTPIFFIIAVLIMGIWIVYSSFRDIGTVY